MLHGTLAFLGLVALAVVATEVQRAMARRGFRAPGLEALALLALGLGLGEHGLGLFASDLLVTLRPVVLLGLAWVGLVFGLQLDLKVVARLKPWHRLTALAIPAGVGGGLVAAGLGLGLRPPEALGLAALGMVSSPSALEGMARGRAIADRTALRLLKLVMAFSGIPAVLVLLVAVAWASPARGAAGPSGWELAGYTVFAGLILGYAMVSLVRGVREHLVLLTLVVGAAAACAGATAVLGVSGLPAAAVMGAVMVNRCMLPHRLLKVAHSLERPMLVALLVLVGAEWGGPGFAWPVFGLMVAVRVPLLVAAGAALAHQANRHATPVRVAGLGMGLLPQGELALGLLVALTGTTLGASGVLEAVVAAMVVNHVAGQWWMRRWLFAEVRDGSGP